MHEQESSKCLVDETRQYFKLLIRGYKYKHIVVAVAEDVTGIAQSIKLLEEISTR